MTQRTLRSKRGAAERESGNKEEDVISHNRRKVRRVASDEKAVGKSEVTLLSIQAIKQRLEDLLNLRNIEGKEELSNLMLELENDPRVSVIALLANIRDRIVRQEVEDERLQIMMEYESRAYARYITEQESMNEGTTLATSAKKGRKKKTAEIVVEDQHYLVGVDEVGVGPLAGPLVSCAVAFKYTSLVKVLGLLNGIDDSKKLSAAKRLSLAKIIGLHCHDHQFGIITSEEVDEMNPLQGSLTAMKRAVLALTIPSSSSTSTKGKLSIDVLVDHRTLPDLDSDIYRQTSITKGDSKSIVIAAASILAKVYRDEYMIRLHRQYPQFAFDRNAGYGTKDHLIQLRKGNLCPEHRLSYEPVRQAKRISMGMPPDVSPKKKKIRPASRSVSPTKVSITRSKPEIGNASTATVLESSSPAPVNSSIFSLSWWTNLLTSTFSAQQ